jgi:hypothetical protein
MKFKSLRTASNGAMQLELQHEAHKAARIFGYLNGGINI